MNGLSDLIPLRALNQVTYCQRLYYLEYVESVMPINEHVEDGLFQHRRVDDPTLQHRPRKDGAVLHTRSVQISSTSLGLSGKLDLVEEKDGEVYPVEYKRGSGPSGDNGQPPFWDNDAVQVCAQAMLLEEELGTKIQKGILYYIGSKTRVEVPLDDDLRQKTLQAIQTIHELELRDSPPEPLPAELRHRCFGCSLAPICQPEETLYCLSHQRLTPAEETAAGITRVLPQIDEGAVLYLQEPGSHVGKRSEHLVVRKDGQEIQRVPIAAIRQVVIFGNVQVSTQALECLATLDVPVVYMTGYGRFIAALQPAPTKNIHLRTNQFRLFADPERALSLAKAVVKAKITNQRTLLMRCLRSRSPDDPVNGNGHAPSPDNGIRGSDEPAAREMAELLTRLDRISDPAVLLGTEGQAAALYFSQFSRMIKLPVPTKSGQTGFDFKSRNRRPPRDPVNALLSFSYALLLKDCFSALCAVGFDPYCGFFHVGRHGKPSLALDVMEEFRAIIADSVVLTLINTGGLAPQDFLVWRDSCHLTEDGRKRFFQAYEQRKATVVTHPVFGYKMSYGRMLEVQARMLAAYVRGDIPNYTGFTVR
ncbi:MAG: CRISPR-associated endonuclease Cas1 [Planctomycetes bacterium]|nr:CRISPR-associated endonuclease Cas1 [Planctomycetota bacterium]